MCAERFIQAPVLSRSPQSPLFRAQCQARRGAARALFSLPAARPTRPIQSALTAKDNVFSIFDKGNNASTHRGFGFAALWVLFAVGGPVGMIGCAVLNGSTWRVHLQNGQLYTLALGLLLSSLAVEIHLEPRSEWAKVYLGLTIMSTLLCSTVYLTATPITEATIGSRTEKVSLIWVNGQSRAASIVFLIAATLFGAVTAVRQIVTGPAYHKSTTANGGEIVP